MNYQLQVITSNGIAVFLLVSLLINMRGRDKRSKDDVRAFVAMLLVNLFQAAAETAAIFIDGRIFPGAITLSTLLNAMLFAGNVIFVTLWSIYADLRTRRPLSRRRALRLLRFMPAALVVLGAAVNLFTPVFFRITEENIYVRCGLYPLTFAVAYFYIFMGVAVAYGFGRRQNMNRYVFLPAVSFVAPVVAASVLQVLMPGSSFLWAGAALGLCAAYVSLLDERASVDALSGTFTRHFLNQRLTALPGQSFNRKLMAGIMLDIDHFKAINDTYGHLMGDDAISNVGRLLRNACEGDSATVYRYAGDEFTILLAFEDDSAISNTIAAINAQVDAFNARAEKPYVLSFSMGHTVYAPGESVSDFVKRMDDAMYEAKRLKQQAQSGEAESRAYTVDAERNCILIVDDDFINREIMKNIFPPQYRILQAENGLEGLRCIDESEGCLCAIVLDMNMPEMNGLELLHILYRRGVTDSVPVFLVTAAEDMDAAREAYSMGAMDVISKPVVPFVILRRVQSVMELFRSRERLSARVRGQEEQLRENANTIDSLHRSTIEAMASAIEFRDVESGQHTHRIHDITKRILSGTEMGMGLSGRDIEAIAEASIMHDIGKIAISDLILNKPGRLTPEEYETMKAHTVKGAALLEQIYAEQESEAYGHAADIARHHHERWDGRGYPDGLAGDQISIAAQVVGIADVYDALVSPRVYKKALHPDKAVEMIVGGECGAFSPKLIKCFLQVEPELREWYEADGNSYSVSELPPRPMPGTEASSEVVNVLLLSAALRSVYDMILFVNLSENTFSMMEHQRFASHRGEHRGNFDDLISAAAELIPAPFSERFKDTFSREALLKAYAKGQRSVYLEYPERSDSGTLHMVSTTVLIMEDAASGDIVEISLTRYTD